jgi:putative ABC transport system permease protein
MSRPGFAWFDSISQDLRYALRTLRRKPVFTFVVVLTLALGIGANTAIFNVTYGILLKPLPFPDSSRLVQIWATTNPSLGRFIFMHGRELDAIVAHGQTFEKVAGYVEGHAKLTGSGIPENVNSPLVSGDFLEMLGVRPVLGRRISSGDIQPGHNQVALLSYRLWQRRFNGDSDVLGKTITLEVLNHVDEPVKEPFTVIGVLPAVFPLPNAGGIDLTIPMVPWENGPGQVIAVGKLKQGVTLAQADADLSVIAAGLAAQYPDKDKGLQLSAGTLLNRMSGQYTTRLFILLGAVSFLLLLACVNVSSLLIARSWERKREVGVRETLGATRPRLIQQFLVESTFLALLGAALSLFVAYGASKLFVAIAPAGTPRLNEVGLDWTVFAYTLATSVVAGILFGIAPALLITRRGLHTSLKEAGGSAAGFSTRRSHALRNSLVIAEIALAFLLVVGSSLALRSFAKLMNIDLGYRPDHLLTTYVNFPNVPTHDLENLNKVRDAHTAKMNEILHRVRALPGVQNAAYADWIPLHGLSQARMQPEGKRESVAIAKSVSQGFFETFGIPLVAGRFFDQSDTRNSPSVAVVNRKLAERYFEGSPLGKRLGTAHDMGGKQVWLRIVGEVADTRDSQPSRDAEPTFYTPMSQNASLLQALGVRTNGNPLAVAEAVRQQIAAVAPDAMAIGIETMDEAVSAAVAEPRFQTQLLSAFGALALLLAVIGIYGVISSAAVQRTHEIGVRLALGAQRQNILFLILGEGFLLAVGGVAAGAAAALALTRYLRSLLFEVTPTDPTTFVAVAVILATVALCACYLPARRAMQVDPVIALRYE